MEGPLGRLDPVDLNRFPNKVDQIEYVKVGKPDQFLILRGLPLLMMINAPEHDHIVRVPSTTVAISRLDFVFLDHLSPLVVDSVELPYIVEGLLSRPASE